jgi:prepilin-type processing-associated H-X9-DG protein
VLELLAGSNTQIELPFTGLDHPDDLLLGPAERAAEVRARRAWTGKTRLRGARWVWTHAARFACCAGWLRGHHRRGANFAYVDGQLALVLRHSELFVPRGGT